MTRRRLLPLLLVLLAGCQQEMARQPSYRPFRPTTFFADGNSARPLVPGTVARGQLPADSHLHTGRHDVQVQDVALLVGTADGLAALTLAPLLKDGYTDTFPFALTRTVLDRGRERFEIFCAVCHDRVGTGNGMIVRRGFTKPPNFHTDLSRGFERRGIALKLRDAPVGYYFEVITHGYGAMPDHASQVPVRDRWAIVAYIRALQLSQRATLADVRDPVRKRRLLDTAEAKP